MEEWGRFPIKVVSYVWVRVWKSILPTRVHHSVEHVHLAVASEVPMIPRTFGEEWTLIERIMSLQGPGSVYCH